MPKWSRETWLVLGVVVLLIGVELIALQQIVLTKETTIFVAQKMNHPNLAAAQTLEQLTGSNEHLKPLHLDIKAWLGKLVLGLGAILIVRNAGKNG